MTINFDHFIESASGYQVCQLLSRGKPTPQQFVARILEEVQVIVPILETGVSYSTEDLCDPEAWTSWRTGLRRSAGMCLRYLAETGELPLEVASPPKKYPLAFRMKRSD